MITAEEKRLAEEAALEMSERGSVSRSVELKTPDQWRAAGHRPALQAAGHRPALQSEYRRLDALAERLKTEPKTESNRADLKAVAARKAEIFRHYFEGGAA